MGPHPRIHDIYLGGGARLVRVPQVSPTLHFQVTLTQCYDSYPRVRYTTLSINFFLFSFCLLFFFSFSFFFCRGFINLLLGTGDEEMYLDPTAAASVLILTFILALGVKGVLLSLLFARFFSFSLLFVSTLFTPLFLLIESVKITTIMVAIKIAIILFVIGAGANFADSDNWQDFSPYPFISFNLCFVLFCFVLFCFVLFCFVLFCFVLF